ncbi:MAG: UDP-N-acetyl glucosamine 2-epimerase, partial [Acidimicrobiia bacterium]|nr:UDP-N-acetyl glucosamine 2-epimerase [Acidimicrobiia bacterium]
MAGLPAHDHGIGLLLDSGSRRVLPVHALIRGRRRLRDGAPRRCFRAHLGRAAVPLCDSAPWNRRGRGNPSVTARRSRPPGSRHFDIRLPGGAAAARPAGRSRLGVPRGEAHAGRRASGEAFGGHRAVIHVFIGTRAEYIKMAPLLSRMEAASLPYRLIDSGQHADRLESFRAELGLREPDFAMGGTRSVNSVAAALWWAAGLGRKLVLPRRLDRTVFGGRRGICVVHGDTPTTLIGALMAKRAGLALAHVEAGLRTHRWLHPFPEEIIRVAVDRLADLLFAPDDTAAEE